MIKCFLCSRRRSSHGTKNILKKMLKIAKMGFLLFCGLRCHCSANCSASSAASASAAAFLSRAAVKCCKKCQAKIVYYIFRPCTQRHTVENLCPTLNGMQAKALPTSLAPLKRDIPVQGPGAVWPWPRAAWLNYGIFSLLFPPFVFAPRTEDGIELCCDVITLCLGSPKRKRIL